MSIKYLKLVKPFPVTLYSGRTDFESVYFAPDSLNNLKLYASLVDESIGSSNYNRALFEYYIFSNILCIIFVPEPIVPVVVPTTPSYTGLFFDITTYTAPQGG